MLHATLEQYSCCQGIDITGHTMRATLIIGIVELVQRRTTEVHRAHRIADERMDTAVESLGIASALTEVQVL